MLSTAFICLEFPIFMYRDLSVLLCAYSPSCFGVKCNQTFDRFNLHIVIVDAVPDSKAKMSRISLCVWVGSAISHAQDISSHKWTVYGNVNVILSFIFMAYFCDFSALFEVPRTDKSIEKCLANSVQFDSVSTKYWWCTTLLICV